MGVTVKSKIDDFRKVFCGKIKIFTNPMKNIDKK